MQLILLAGYWVLYFALHSLLASLSVKQRVADKWPNSMPWYRLLFNGLASVLILPPLYLTFTIGGAPLWAWSGIWAYISWGITLLAVAGFFYTLRYYDGAEFLGLRQLQAQEKRVEDQEHFHLSPLHYHVRHPWYFLGLLLIWTRDMPPAMLLSAVFMSLYFVLGSRWEERKLLRYHGKIYAEYKTLVPGLIPLPWKRLNSDDRARLQALAKAP